MADDRPCTNEPLVTSRTGRVKAARRLASRQERLVTRRFLAEGPRAVGEALAAPGVVVEVYATPAATTRHAAMRRDAVAAGLDWYEAGDDVVDAICTTVHPQGVVAVCRFVDVALSEALTTRPKDRSAAGSLSGASSGPPAGSSAARLVVVGVEVRDPGNAGTLVRCADAAGAGAVVFCGPGVDPYNPKAVRASAGSVFHLPMALDPDPATAVAAIRAAGLQVLAADGAADLDLDDAEAAGLLAAPTAWLLGNEARGLDPVVLALADAVVSVPLYGRAESLNLGAAAAVCLYASARVQRASRRLPD